MSARLAAMETQMTLLIQRVDAAESRGRKKDLGMLGTMAGFMALILLL